MPSSAISAIHYDQDQEQLTVKFTSGRIYRYFDVPPHIAAGFRLAASQGNYFNTRIRGRYRFQEFVVPAKRSARYGAGSI
jgi:KTSC domain